MLQSLQPWKMKCSNNNNLCLLVVDWILIDKYYLVRILYGVIWPKEKNANGNFSKSRFWHVIVLMKVEVQRNADWCLSKNRNKKLFIARSVICKFIISYNLYLIFFSFFQIVTMSMKWCFEYGWKSWRRQASSSQ